jgi:GT2 family glycosyltransferase
VSWNAKDYLQTCLKSIFSTAELLDVQVLVVDNASSDGSAVMVTNEFPHVNLFAETENSGFACANNKALALSRSPYVLLLNPDTVVYPGALQSMIEYMETHPTIGACGCRLIHPDSGKVETAARGYPQLLPLFWNLCYMDRLFPHNRFFSAYLMTYQSEDTPYEVDWLTGACLMVRRTAVDEVGYLDPNFFMYCEDIDWCYRIKRTGWGIAHLPSVMIGHYRGQSSKLRRRPLETHLSIWGARQYTRSILYFYQKHYGSTHAVFLRLILVLTAIWRAGLWLVAGTLRYGWRVGFTRAVGYLSTTSEIFPLRKKPEK